MKGTITIKASEHGYGLDLSLDDVSLQDKFELMHTLATALEMDEIEMAMYIFLEQQGVLAEAESVTHCETDEEVHDLLMGGKVNEG